MINEMEKKKKLKREPSSKELKREKKRKSLTKNSIDQNEPSFIGENTLEMDSEYVPGKRGGSYTLPGGGHLTVDNGVLTKKESVKVQVVSPSERHKYIIDMHEDEAVLSEVFIITLPSRMNIRPVRLQLPFYENLAADNERVLLRSRSPNSLQWNLPEFAVMKSKYDEGQSMVNFECSRSAILLVSSGPKTERFTIPVAGILHTCSLSNQLSLRFPKRATDVEIMCEIKIVAMNRGNLEALAREHPATMGDIREVSDFYDISLMRQGAVFRRPVTVRLPLPFHENTDFQQEDLAVMQMVNGAWQVLETPLKFTKTVVSFDVRSFTRYCVALARRNKVGRLKEAFKMILIDDHVIRGEVLTFLHTTQLEGKKWILWMDLAANDKCANIIEQRKRQGFRHIEKAVEKVVEEVSQQGFSRRSWRRKTSETPPPKKNIRTDIDLVSGRPLRFQLKGDIQIIDIEQGDNVLRYDERLQCSYRRFFIEPLPEDNIISDELREFKALTSTLTITNGLTDNLELRKFTVDVDCSTAKDFLYNGPSEKEAIEIEEVEKQPKMKTKISLMPTTPLKLSDEARALLMATGAPVVQEIDKETPVKRRSGEMKSSSASFLRLTKTHKPAREAIRESKVLTGRSLSCLAQRIEQGLTLAIYLGISDSTITGLGFDALARGQNLVDITYRILLLWKRRSYKLKNRQAEALADALKDMGLLDVAAILMDRHRMNLEITPECFGSDEENH